MPSWIFWGANFCVFHSFFFFFFHSKWDNNKRWIILFLPNGVICRTEEREFNRHLCFIWNRRTLPTWNITHTTCPGIATASSVAQINGSLSFWDTGCLSTLGISVTKSCLRWKAKIGKISTAHTWGNRSWSCLVELLCKLYPALFTSVLSSASVLTFLAALQYLKGSDNFTSHPEWQIQLENPG